MNADIHVGDVITFEITVKDETGAVVDLSGATEKTIVFRKPSGTNTDSDDLEFVTDGKDGQVKYSVEADFLDAEGTWYMQIYVEMPTGSQHSSIEKIKVKANL